MASLRPFTPAWRNITSVVNATSATAAVTLPFDCDTVSLANTSATAIVYVYVTFAIDGVAPTGIAPTATTGFPILPNQQETIGVPVGMKVIRTIASAANGNIIITPGRGLI